MNPRAVWLAWSVCGLTLALIVCAFVLFFLNHFGIRELPYFLVAEATAALVGGLISSRRPRNPVGWIVAGHAFCFSFGEFSRQYAIYGLQTDPGTLPFALAMASPVYWIWFPGIILMFSFLPLYFPDGRLVSPRWRPVFWLAVLAGLLQTGTALIRPTDTETPGIPNPLGIEGLRDLTMFGRIIDAVGSAPWLAVGVLSAASLVVRFRRSRGEGRQQIKWVVYAVVLAVSYSLVDQFLLGDRIPYAADFILFILFFEGLWVAIAVAILRYRLYELPPLRHRCRHKLHPRLRYAHRIARAPLPRQHRPSPGALSRADRPGVRARRRGLDSSHRSAVRTAAPPRAGVHRPSLLPWQVRRGEDARNILGQAARRDGSGQLERGSRRGGQRDDATDPRLDVAAAS